MATQELKCTEVNCPKCDGKGYLQEFRHIANGRCFMCAGNKTLLLTVNESLKKRKRPLEASIKNVHYSNGEIQSWVEFFVDGVGYNGYWVHLMSEEKKEEFRFLWRWHQMNGKTYIRNVDPYGVPLP